MVPTVFACYDVAVGSRLSPGLYAARSLLEVFVLVPVWAYFWVGFFEFLLFGWIGP